MATYLRQMSHPSKFTTLLLSSYTQEPVRLYCSSLIGALGEPLTTDWVGTGTSTAAYLGLEKCADKRIEILQTCTIKSLDLNRSFVAHEFVGPAESDIYKRKLISMLYFAGYLTIEKYEPSTDEVHLKYTNSETGQALANHIEESMKGQSANLMHYMLHNKEKDLTKFLEEGNYKDYFDAIKDGFVLAKEEERSERFFSNWIYLAHWNVIHEKCKVEYSGCIETKFHIDMACEFKEHIVLFEFKAKPGKKVVPEAIGQFWSSHYVQKFGETNKKVALILIVMNFCKTTLSEAVVYVVDVNGIKAFEEFTKKIGNVTKDFRYVYPLDNQIIFGKDTVAEETKSESKKKRNRKKNQEGEYKSSKNMKGPLKAGAKQKNKQKIEQESIVNVGSADNEGQGENVEQEDHAEKKENEGQDETKVASTAKVKSSEESLIEKDDSDEESEGKQA
eukprot:TRINITY_DN2179_c0_g1_i1.p1 TRINITY_DN2179_c0_g1~~TRINITY_DN2179_c0_g1_i1.p1  ORF type:complete len:447 (-),score=50.41 TRINITY_DN2179_c0_g1_i1:434-1774(-)